MAEASNSSHGDAAFTTTSDNSTTSSSKQQQPHASSGGFDCNICLELALDPVVTLCGHLFCWPCLYRWLHVHSTCQECPVCKALVEEDKVIPLYSRGNPSIDPRKKPPPFIAQAPDNLHYPHGNRLHSDRPPDLLNTFNPHYGFDFVAPSPVAAARSGNISFFSGYGLLASLLSPCFHGFPDATSFGAGYPFGFPGGFHGASRAYSPPPAGARQEAWLFKLFVVLGTIAIVYFMLF